MFSFFVLLVCILVPFFKIQVKKDNFCGSRSILSFFFPFRVLTCLYPSSNLFSIGKSKSSPTGILEKHQIPRSSNQMQSKQSSKVHQHEQHHSPQCIHSASFQNGVLILCVIFNETAEIYFTWACFTVLTGASWDEKVQTWHPVCIYSFWILQTAWQNPPTIFLIAIQIS